MTGLPSPFFHFFFFASFAFLFYVFFLFASFGFIGRYRVSAVSLFRFSILLRSLFYGFSTETGVKMERFVDVVVGWVVDEEKRTRKGPHYFATLGKNKVASFDISYREIEDVVFIG